MDRTFNIRRLVLSGAVLWAFALAAAVPQLWERGSLVRVVGWSYAPPTETPRVTEVVAGGPADGLLHVGDRILSIDGREAPIPAVYTWEMPPGTGYRAQVLREGRVVEVDLRVGSRFEPQWPLIGSFLFGSLTFAAIAWLMGWQGSHLRTARLGWLASQLTAFVYLGLALTAAEGRGWKPSVVSCLLRSVGNCHLLFAFWFVAEFPYPPPASRLWRGIRLALAGPFLVAWWITASVNLALIGGPLWVARLPVGWDTVLSPLTALNTGLIGTAVVGVLIRNYRVLHEPAARRSIALVSGAIAFAVVTLGVVALAARMRGELIPPWANLAPLPIPLCFAYAVLRHKVLDLRLVLHRSVQYLLARQLLRALTLLPLGLMVIRAIADPTAPIDSLFNLAGIVLVAAAAVGLEFRGRLRHALDRWYQRPMLVREQQLRALAAEIAGLPWPEIEETVPGRLVTILDLAGAEVDRHGALRLGAKQSGDPLTDTEQQLLEHVSAQVLLQYERWVRTEDHEAAIQAERQRIAREIHDTAGQGFAGIALYLEAARKTFQAGAPKEANQFLEEAGALARKSLQETRASIAGLREAPDMDLAARLQDLADRNDAGPPFVSVHVAPDALPRASAEVRWHLARIAEEAVTNACKHAAASRICVEFEGLQEAVRLRIYDDGLGFDPSLAGREGYGLAGMRERMEQLRGTLTVISSPGKGTEICAEVPV